MRDSQQARQQLATAKEELVGLRSRATVARELEDRVRQLQAEKLALEQHAATLVSREDLDRSAAARTETDEKLAVVLRAYAQVARERDGLREQPPAERPVTPEPVAAAPAPARPAVVAPSPARTTPAPRATALVTPRPEAVRRASLAAAPTNRVAGRPAFSHRIAPGETLSTISQRYYGTPARWQEIVAANADVLADQRSFTAGKMLRIP
jgi:nucleoid-associated protein YgaU